MEFPLPWSEERTEAEAGAEEEEAGRKEGGDAGLTEAAQAAGAFTGWDAMGASSQYLGLVVILS